MRNNDAIKTKLRNLSKAVKNVKLGMPAFNDTILLQVVMDEIDAISMDREAYPYAVLYTQP